jgi:signal transduction histidine kinase
LLVEDDLSIRTTLGDLLVEEGLSVTATPNGRDALAELRAAPIPDVILLDLMMPVMDGWEFRVEQRADPMLAGIPLIAMSADMSAKARAIAADRYIRKPIDFPELLTEIRNVVEHAAKQRLAAADRMAALGTLASGIAHEINNPLTYVMANLNLLAGKLAEHRTTAGAEEMAELVGEALEGAERIRRIVKQAQMVAPVRREERLETLDLRACLEAALELTDNQIKHRALLVREYSGRPRVRADRGRIEQLLMNLLLNAVQAIPEGRASENRIRVSVRTLPPERVVVEIADSGQGIPTEIQERVFQPFFTTKPVGQGTGLGLAICQGIVAALGGEISFESETGRGTTFRVVLPSTDLPLDEPVPRPRGTLTPVPVRPRVLVVDGEPAILRVVRQFLEPGHDVTAVSEAAEAQRLIQEGRRFDLVLCELMLPGGAGMNLLEDLSRLRPALAERLLFMTAGAFTPRAREFLEQRKRPCLSKPFDREQLLAQVAAMLEDHPLARPPQASVTEAAKSAAAEQAEPAAPTAVMAPADRP